MQRMKVSVPPHPRGVAPLGSSLLPSAPRAIRSESLGAFATLSDSDLIDVLKMLPGRALGALARASRACYVFANEEEVWKEKVVGERDGYGAAGFEFFSTWRLTWLMANVGAEALGGYGGEVALGPWEGLYSDYLYQGWVGSAVELDVFDREENIDRVHASELSVEEFVARYDRENKPVIIEGAIEHWPAMADGLWTAEALAERHGDVRFAVGPAELTVGEYYAYARQTADESPLYLFDKAFGEKDPGLLDEYDVPAYFRSDFFAALPADVRPRFRWFLIGPARSGSSFHKDPNFTSAWNGLVSGCKRWVLFPPNYTPPGVHPSGDGWNVTTPLSLASWFLNFYTAARDPSAAVAPTLAVQRPGDVIFIPSQHWHTALNLEESVAVTQNYVSEANVVEVLDFLSRKPDTTLYDALAAHMADAHPGLLDTIKADRAASGWADRHYFPMPRPAAPPAGSGAGPAASPASASASAPGPSSAGWWDDVKRSAEETKQAGGFTFAFGS